MTVVQTYYDKDVVEVSFKSIIQIVSNPGSNPEKCVVGFMLAHSHVLLGHVAHARHQANANANAMFPSHKLYLGRLFIFFFLLGRFTPLDTQESL